MQPLVCDIFHTPVLPENADLGPRLFVSLPAVCLGQDAGE